MTVSTKTQKGRKPQRNTLYLPTSIRNQVEKIAVEVSYRRGKRISDSGFVQHLIKKYSKQAMEELVYGDTDLPEE